MLKNRLRRWRRCSEFFQSKLDELTFSLRPADKRSRARNVKFSVYQTDRWINSIYSKCIHLEKKIPGVPRNYSERDVQTRRCHMKWKNWTRRSCNIKKYNNLTYLWFAEETFDLQTGFYISRGRIEMMLKSSEHKIKLTILVSVWVARWQDWTELS